MPKPERTLVEKITTIAGAIAALGGVLAAATQFSDQVKALLGKLAELPAPAWWMIAALLLSLGIFGLMHGLARRSRLLRPEALLLKSHKAEHLKGREEDIDRLLKLCREHPLVHLVGESGAGKSALLQAGLCPKLRDDNTGLLPIYIDVWGQNWEAGPRSALTEALGQALSDADQQALKLKTDDLFAALKRCRPSLRRTPLLIFDQFDDYQTRHRDRFLSSRQRTWLSAEKLVAANAFWREIKALLDDDAIHCLFVTRLDAADGLKSVRFIKEDEVYRLDRLQENIVAPLLTELTSSTDENVPIIYAPERGWDKLKEHLAGDLSQSGAVLPAQMKIALQGLARLKTLTIGDYQRIGGLAGLEARHIEGHITEAERHFAHTKQGTQLTQKQIRDLLLALVNPETLKTVPRSIEELEQVLLAEQVGESKPVQSTVQDCLAYLQQREIIRKRIEPDTRGELWLLDHDYLCAGVLEAERRANRWLALLETGSRAFDEAGNHLLKKWRALLSPWQQTILIVQRFRGHFRLGTLRSFALWSLLRFVPYLVTILMLNYGWQQFFAKEQANHILSKIGIGSAESDLTSSEMDALWTLATSSEAVRFSFLDQSLAIPENAERLDRRVDFVVHALVGLDPNRRERVFKNVLLPYLQPSHTDSRIKTACVKIGVALEIKDSTFASFAVQSLVEAMLYVSNADALEALSYTLIAVSEYLSPTDADRVFDQILLQMEARQASWLKFTTEPLKAVAQKMSSVNAERIFARTLFRMEKINDSDTLRCQAEALAAIVSRVGKRDVEHVFTQIVTKMEMFTDAHVLQSLAKVLAVLPGKLDAKDADRAFAQILSQINKTTDSDTLQSLSEALAAVPGQLAPKHAERIFDHILVQMEKPRDPFAPGYLAQALAAATEKLGPEYADQAFTQILIHRKRNIGLDLYMREALVAVARKLTTKSAYRMFAQNLELLKNASYWWDGFLSLSEVLALVAERIKSDDANRAFTQILEQMDKADDNSGELRMLAEAFAALAKTHTPQHADVAFTRILARVQKAENSWMRQSLSKALAAAASRATPKDDDQAFTQILGLLESAADRDVLQSLATALAAIAGDRTPQQLIDLMKWPACVGEVRAPLLAKLEQQTDQKFEGNVWKMVEWAQANGYDVKSLPRRPSRE